SAVRLMVGATLTLPGAPLVALLSRVIALDERIDPAALTDRPTLPVVVGEPRTVDPRAIPLGLPAAPLTVSGPPVTLIARLPGVTVPPSARTPLVAVS